MNERATDHAGHDALLLAAWAAGDAEGADLARAQALVAACPECARLVDDLRSIAAALPSAAVPRRPRDFRLRVADVEQAATASPVARLRRSVEAFGRSLVPVGAGLATIGIAGLLLAGTSGLLGPRMTADFSTVGGPVPAAEGASRDAGDNAAGGGALAPGVASPAASVANQPDRPAATGAPGGGQGQSIPSPSPTGPEELAPIPSPVAPAGPPLLVVGSIALLGLGVVLLAIGRTTRSRAGPPD